MTTTLEPPQLAEYLTGHAEVEDGPAGGVLPHRVPAALRAQTDDPFFAWVEGCPAGVSLRLRTAAAQLRLSVALTTRRPTERETLVPFLTVRDGDAVNTYEPLNYSVEVEHADGTMTLHRAQAELITINRSPVAAELEIMLPHRAQIELLRLEVDGEVQPAAADQRPRWIHYGSSISHCFESLSPDRTWPAQVARAFDVQLRNLSFAGHAQLDQFIARQIRDTPAELITLKVGINPVAGDMMRERIFRPALEGFLDTVREGHPETPIIVISPISCPMLEDSPGPVLYEGDRFRVASRQVESDDGALTLSAARQIVGAVTTGRQRLDQNLVYLDGLELLGHADAHLLFDDLHPNQEGYDLIAQRFSAALPQR